ncbi:DEAD/DEAH box helicase [Schinkia azotoformans]|uniref:DEAD/DEAH box helicase n=1 Tax=Schinkia azotoformans TaxID=1454 RepID=UPI002DB5B0D8|nr:SNF2-related protein [Schinkia azotoformans]MEC1757664.1 SNF2-related protein [Schinkia azotoformans]
MIKQLQYEIQVDYLDSNQFIIYAKHLEQNGRRAALGDWRPLLFSWHAESYFGTKFSEVGEGVQLSSWDILQFFSDAAHQSSLFSFSFGKSVEWLRKWAPVIFTEVVEGRIVPDFAQWNAGKFGWKLMNSFSELKIEEESSLFTFSFIREWLSEAIMEFVKKDEALGTRWAKILEKHPALLKQNKGSDETVVFINEETWLEQIGWTPDQAPFTVELRLSEPVDESTDEALDDSMVNMPSGVPEAEMGSGNSWTLDILLRDKTNANHWIEWKNNDTASAVPAEWHSFLSKITKSIELWGHIVPWLKSANPDEGIIHSLREDQAWTFLSESSIQLAEAGVEILLPSWWQEIRAMNPKMKIQLRSSVGSTQQSLLGLQAIGDFDWKFATGNAELDENEFLQLVEQNRRLVKVNGKWMKLDPAFIKQVKEIMVRVKKEGLSFQDILAQELMTAGTPGDQDNDELDNPLSQIQIGLNTHLEKLIFQLHNITSIPSINIPNSLHGELRAYQKQGVEWLVFLRKFGFGACLADDMGLGKTVQMITYFLYIKELEKPKMPALIICPTSVLGNWQRELQKFSPMLNVHLHYGSSRKKGEELAQTVADYDIVLTSYGLSAMDEEDLKAISWSTICLDEAQNIKNAFTKQSTAIRSFNGQHHIALTGTPIENRLTELWTIFDFINRGYLSSLHSFSRRYVAPIEKNKDEKKIKQVQQLVKPFLLRRTKKDEIVSLNLPDKQEQKEYIPLTVEQASLYEQLIQDTFDRIEKLSGMERRGLILSMLTKLKQICNHPALYLKDDFSELSLLERSNKMEKLIELLENILNQGESSLIFTQYIGMGKMIQHVIQEHFGETVHFLQGSLRKQDRDNIIDSFQDGQQKLLILSLKAGGTGLNLTAANHVIHYDRWWNPAVENQATDRAYRIGQKRFVHVHKLITTGTLEEKIDEMIEKKKSLSDDIISGENWITELSTDELRDLFTLRKDWSE